LHLGICIQLLLDAGGVAKHDVPPVLDLLRGRLDYLAELLDSDAAPADRQFPELDFGVTGARRLSVRGVTLLHVAAEYGNVEAAELFLDRGADVNARATVDESGIGGQRALFHAVTQFGDCGLLAAQLLMDHGAYLSVRVRLPRHYERPGEIVECTPLGYALRFPGGENKTVAKLRERGAAE